jgi:hypothetical protein
VHVCSACGLGFPDGRYCWFGVFGDDREDRATVPTDALPIGGCRAVYHRAGGSSGRLVLPGTDALLMVDPLGQFLVTHHFFSTT